MSNAYSVSFNRINTPKSWTPQELELLNKNFSIVEDLVRALPLGVTGPAGAPGSISVLTDHGLLTGLLDDDHPQYLLLAGRAGGQTITGIGSTAISALTIQTVAVSSVAALTLSNPDQYLSGSLPPLLTLTYKMGAAINGGMNVINLDTGATLAIFGAGNGGGSINLFASASNPIFRVTPAAGVILGPSFDPAVVPFTIRANAAQSANLSEWYDASSSLGALVDTIGRIRGVRLDSGTATNYIRIAGGVGGGTIDEVQSASSNAFLIRANSALVLEPTGGTSGVIQIGYTYNGFSASTNAAVRIYPDNGNHVVTEVRNRVGQTQPLQTWLNTANTLPLASIDYDGTIRSILLAGSSYSQMSPDGHRIFGVVSGKNVEIDVLITNGYHHNIATGGSVALDTTGATWYNSTLAGVTTLRGDDSLVLSTHITSPALTIASAGAVTFAISIITPAIRLTTSPSSGYVLTSDVSGNGAWVALPTGIVDFDDSTFIIHDNLDPTKKIAFQISPVATGTTRTLTAPNADGTIALLEAAQQWSGENTFKADFYIGQAGFGSRGFIDPASLTADHAYSLPDFDGTIVLDNGSGAVFSINCGTGTILKSSSSISGASFSDNGTSSKRLRMVLSGAIGNNSITLTNTSARNYGLGNLSGNIVTVGDDPPAVASGALGKVDSTAQGADIATTNLSNTPPAGLYLVEVYLACTTADATAGTLTVTIGLTDVVGATTDATLTAFSLAATGRTNKQYLLQVSSGNITYATAITGIYGTAKYAIYIRVVSLG